MRKRPGFWIALVLFLGLAAYIQYYESRRPPDVAPEEAPFLAIEPARVHAITSFWLADTTRIVKEADGSWWIVSPVRFPADPVAVEALLSRVRKLEVLRHFPLEDGQANRYGLDVPRAWDRFHLTDSSQVTLWIGAPAQASPAFYVQVEGGSEVALLNDNEVDNFFRKETDAWRRRNLFSFRPESLVDVAFDPQGHEVRFVRDNPTAPWRMAKPFPGPVDGNVVSDYLKGLVAMKARSYPVERPGSLAPYGLDDPVAEVVVTAVTGRRDTLAVGSLFDAPTGPERYARTSEVSNIFGVPPAYRDVLSRSDFYFRRQRPFNTSLKDATALLAAQGSDSLTFTPDSSGAWRLRGEGSSPGAPPPDRTDLVADWVLGKADSIVAFREGSFRPSTPPLVVEIRGPLGPEKLEIGAAIRSQDREIWPARLIFADPGRPEEVFHLRSEQVSPVLALFERFRNSRNP